MGPLLLLRIFAVQRTQVSLDPGGCEEAGYIFARHKGQQLIPDFHPVAVAEFDQLSRVSLLEQQETQQSTLTSAVSGNAA